MTQHLLHHYPKVLIYPDQDEHARQIANAPPIERSATPSKKYAGGAAERTASGDAKYGDWVVQSWIIVRK